MSLFANLMRLHSSMRVLPGMRIIHRIDRCHWIAKKMFTFIFRDAKPSPKARSILPRKDFEAAHCGERGHPLVGMTQNLIWRTTTAIGNFSTLLHGCYERISQALAFARMANDMAAIVKMYQTPFQDMLRAFLPKSALVQRTAYPAAQPATAALFPWPSIFGIPAPTPAPATTFAPWLATPAALEAAAVIVPAAAFVTAIAEMQAQLPNVFTAFFAWA